MIGYLLYNEAVQALEKAALKDDSKEVRKSAWKALKSWIADQKTLTMDWPLGNGESLMFTVYSFDVEWHDVAGLYIFAYIGKDSWHPLYIGQVDSFKSRLSSHERRDEAIRKGATHIHTILVEQAAKRDKWEKMLIQHLEPPMNSELL